MKTIKFSLGVLLGSPLFWIGWAAALGSLFTYLMLWSGHLNWFALLADKLYVGLFIGSFLAAIFLAGICLIVCGLILGLWRFAKALASRADAAGAISISGRSNEKPPTGTANPSTAGRKTRLVALIAVFSLLILVAMLNLPSSYTASDPCQVRVVDDNNLPVAGLRVVRSWGFSLQHYGAEEGRTDAKGTVNFPPVGVEISLLKRLEMRCAPTVVHSWYPGRDSLPVTVYLPENLAARFDSQFWRPAIPGDLTAYTNQSGVFVRYLRAYALPNQNLDPASRTGFKIPRPNNTVGVGIPDGIHEVEIQVGENARSL
jgi:hypothetical protein